MLSELLENFAATLTLDGCGDRTAQAYCRDVAQFFGFAGHNNPAAITDEQLWTWDARISHEFHHHTRRRKRVSLSRFLAYIAKYHPQLAPKLERGLAPLKDRPSDPFILHPDDFKAILLSCYGDVESVNWQSREARDGAIIAFLGTTGVRREECVRLRVRDVVLSADGKNFIAYIRSTKIAGRGGEQDHRIRQVNFGNLEQSGDISTAHFGLWFIERCRMLGTQFSERKRDLPLFSDLANSTHPLHPTSLYLIVRRACDRTGKINLSKVTPHTFRHFFATHAYLNGMDVRVLQHYLGHASIEQTYRYVHLADKATGLQAREHGPTINLRAKDSLILPTADIQRIFRTSMSRSV